MVEKIPNKMFRISGHFICMNNIGHDPNKGPLGTYYVEQPGGGSTGQERQPKDAYEKNTLDRLREKHNKAHSKIGLQAYINKVLSDGQISVYGLGHHKYNI